jgi:hypothetical protein
MPLFITALAPGASLIIFVSGTSLLFLALLGALARARGRRKRHPEHNTGNVLGCAGHGDNRRRRGLVRNRRISGTGRRRRKLRLHADFIELLHSSKSKLSALMPSRLKLDR